MNRLIIILQLGGQIIIKNVSYATVFDHHQPID